MKTLFLSLLTAAWMFAADASGAEGERWASTLERIKHAAVSIRVDSTRAYDGAWNASSEASGFIVDADRGLVLTNRHVVTPGPVVAEGVLVNGEEIALTPVYRDPVHDFGFYRYDPSELRFARPVSLPLHPDGAKVGADVRIIGNDAGEKLSILSGTLAKLDRKAPFYGRNVYNDFNTFYIQAASGTSGGSSGSPVIDIDGRVVALNAGARNRAASSYFLPLGRVARALAYLQDGQMVPRGTLGTTFVHSPFDELRRLGLALEDEREARARPSSTGMLVVERVLNDSPAADVLKPGDLLLRLNHQVVTTFDQLASVLDNRVSEEIDLTLQRGATTMDVTLEVMDLHNLTPASMVEYSGGSFHDLSYQQARSRNVKQQGIYVAAPGYAFGAAGVGQGDVITEVNRIPIEDLAQFQALLRDTPDGEQFSVRFVPKSDIRRTEITQVRADRRWFPARSCALEALGDWYCEPLTELADREQPSGPTPIASRITLPKQKGARLKALAPSLVDVRYDMPYRIEGAPGTRHRGIGVIVDAEEGLVVVDRNTVPSGLGDARVTFAGQLELPAVVLGLHPLRNLVLLQYDPQALGKSPFRAVKYARKQALPGDEVWLVSHSSDQRLIAHSTAISTFEGLNPPVSSTLGFRETNLSAYSVVNHARVRSAVLANKRGELVGLWTAYSDQASGERRWAPYGLTAEEFRRGVSWLRSGDTLQSLEAEFSQISIAAARKRGLSEAWLGRLGLNDGDVLGSPLEVVRAVAGTPAASLVQGGDLLLSIDGQPISDFVALADAVASQDSVTLKLFRDGQEVTLAVSTVRLDRQGVDRVVSWAGAMFHAPHRAAREAGVTAEGAYVSFYFYGSPASRQGIFALRNVVAINDLPVSSLDDLLTQIGLLGDRAPVRLRLRTRFGEESVKTFKADHRYWPAYEFVWTQPDSLQGAEAGQPRWVRR